MLTEFSFSFQLQDLFTFLINRPLPLDHSLDETSFLSPFVSSNRECNQTITENVRSHHLESINLKDVSNDKDEGPKIKLFASNSFSPQDMRQQKINDPSKTPDQRLDELIVGCNAFKKEWKRLILWPSQQTIAMNRLQIPLSGGLLVFGPPGCGKTFSVLQAASVCNDKRRIFHVEGPKIFSKWLGDAERNIRRLFAEARLQPSIIIIDEVDSLGSSRSQLSEATSTASSTQQRVLCSLLAEMDGIGERIDRDDDLDDDVDDDDDDHNSSDPSSLSFRKRVKQRKVIVVGCTNRPDRMDDALIRPGRFDQVAYIGLPSQQERLLLLQRLCRFDDPLSLVADPSVRQHLSDHVAPNTNNFTFADLQQLWREVCLCAIEEWSLSSPSSPSSSPSSSENAIIFPHHFDQALCIFKPQPISEELIAMYNNFSSTLCSSSLDQINKT